MDQNEELNESLAGRYEIEREIGRGGMAFVYLARDIRHSRKVALKVMSPELTAEVGAERFVQEIAITAPYVHPNIVALYDSGLACGRPYYVMPYVEGPTLRQLLRRELQLPFDEVIQIAKQIAAALDYAHARGVIHRDMKPDNVLLLNRHVLVADFGLARAITSAASTPLTSKRMVVGTPEYMSPEQCTPGREMDGRTDIYSLGCVVFEMITGVPPFRGASANATMMHHLTSDPPSVKRERIQCPIGYDAVLGKALAKVPADRFRSASDFVAALERATPLEVRDERPLPVPVIAPRGSAEPSHPWWKDWRTRRLNVAAVGLTALAGGTLAVWLMTRDPAISATEIAPARSDRTASAASRYAIFPVEIDSIPGRQMSASVGGDLTGILVGVLQRWEGIEIVDPQRLRAAVDGGGTLLAMPDTAMQRAAVSVAATHYVRVRATPLAKHLQVRIALFDSRGRDPPLERSARIAPDLIDADVTMGRVIDSLLFPAPSRGLLLSSSSGTRSFAARRAYALGHRAVEQWNLRQADSAFASAAELDDNFTEGLLWSAQVKLWRDEPPRNWARAADRAATASASLSPRDSVLALALSALASGRRDVACQEWTTMTRLFRSDFAGWYDLGNCLANDSVVVLASGRDSAFRFRSSYHAALAAYERAFRLLPSTHHTFGGGSSDNVTRLFKASRLLRTGRGAPPDTTQFLAYPTWQGDTLAFIPLKASEFHAARAVSSPSVNEAVYRQRRKFLDIAAMWRSTYPRSPDALEAVAIALDMLGDPSALDSLRRARRESVDPDDRIRRGVFEVLMGVKSAMPDRTSDLRRAKALADSLLDQHQPSTEQEAALLATIATLTGRANRAASLSREAPARSAPQPIAQHGPALVAFAALGGPLDSLHALEQQVERAMAALLAEGERKQARGQWLLRAAILAVPEHQFEFIAREMSTSNFHERLLSAWRRTDLPGAHAVLAELRAERVRGAIRSWDVGTDGLYAEAAILAALGDAPGAVSWLDPTLDSLAFVATQALTSAPRSGALVRAAVLRADLAVRLGDRAEAKRWAAAAATLWSGSDPFLQSTLTRMRRLAR